MESFRVGDRLKFKRWRHPVFELVSDLGQMERKCVIGYSPFRVGHYYAWWPELAEKMELSDD